MKTVKDLYKMSKEALVPYPLLTSYNPAGDIDWWNDYRENFSVFDEQFMRQFKTFVFFDQESDETDEDIMTNWQSTLYSWMMMNDKRYSELYRIHVIPDDESYALTNNYDLHETYSGNSTGASAVISGQRTDVTIDQIGSQNTADQNNITGWNSNSENANNSNTTNIGSRNENHQFTKGQETDTTRSQGTDGHTLRRYGNIGVMTIEDMLQKHDNFWQVFNFYQIIFNDICKNFLLIGR